MIYIGEHGKMISERRSERGEEGLTYHQQSKDKHIRYSISEPLLNMSCKIKH